jgi:hypothetical protein
MQSGSEELRDVVVLRRGRSFDVVVGASDDGRRRVALVAARAGDSMLEARARAFATAHRANAGGCIPPVYEERQVGARACVIFDVDATVDAESLAHHMRDDGLRVPYSAVVGLLVEIARALERAHGSFSANGAPIAAGALPLARLVFDEHGACHFLGLGDPELALDCVVAGAVLAPELALGGTPSPSADIAALAALMRTVVPLVDLPAPLARVLSGTSVLADAPVLALVQSLGSQAWAWPAPIRPSLTSMRRAFEGLVRLLGVSPSLGEMEGFVREILRARSAHAPQPSSDAVQAIFLAVEHDASTFRLADGPTVSLRARPSLRRILLGLVQANRAAGPALDVWALLAAGWPGETLDPIAGSNRVYAAIAALRRLGLRRAIDRDEVGYRLAPHVALTIEGGDRTNGR